MKRYPAIAYFMAATVLLSSSCGGGKKSDAEIERENWLLSLNDSVSAYQKRIEDAGEELKSVHSEIGEMISDFDHVSNPRLVEGYYIYKGWSGQYPLSKTGIVARITQDEGFELIAALSGAHFDRIKVSCGDIEAESSTVPHDQALNYRTASLNTVCFFGAEADSIGRLIAGNAEKDLTLTFINGGTTGKFDIPADEKRMISATWKLFASQREAHRLENEIPMLSRRIAACRRMLEANDSVLNK